MPGNGAYAFTEPGDYEASVYEAKIELVVTGGGRFKAALTRAELGQLHLLRSQEDLASIAYVRLRADVVFVGFPTRFNPPPVWGGQELRSGEIVFHGHGEPMHMRTAGSSEKSFIALKPEHLAFWSNTLTGTQVLPPTFARIIRHSQATTSRLRYLHASACGLVEKSPTTRATSGCARDRAGANPRADHLPQARGPAGNPVNQISPRCRHESFRECVGGSPRPALAHAGTLFGDRCIGANLACVLCRVPWHNHWPVSSAPAIEIGADGAAIFRTRDDERRRGRQTVRLWRAWSLRGHVSRRLWRGAVGHAAA